VRRRAKKTRRDYLIEHGTIGLQWRGVYARSAARTRQLHPVTDEVSWTPVSQAACVEDGSWRSHGRCEEPTRHAAGWTRFGLRRMALRRSGHPVRHAIIAGTLPRHGPHPRQQSVFGNMFLGRFGLQPGVAETSRSSSSRGRLRHRAYRRAVRSSSSRGIVVDSVVPHPPHRPEQPRLRPHGPRLRQSRVAAHAVGVPYDPDEGSRHSLAR